MLEVKWSTFIALSPTCPEIMESLAPMRTKMASTGVSSKDLAGTKAPTWASRAARQTCHTQNGLSDLLYLFRQSV